MIPWRPIAELPDELKDGRQILVWGGKWPCLVEWFGGDWLNSFTALVIENPTHFAEITPPEPDTATVSLASILPDDPMADIPA